MKNGNILPTICQPDIYILKINNDNNINIIDTIKNESGIELIHVIELKNENLVSADYWKYKIKLWKKNNNNKYEENIVIKENNRIEDVIEIKNNIIGYDVCNNNIIIFYDLNSNKKLNTFNNIEVNDWTGYKRFCLINDNKLLYSCKNEIHFFDINKYKYIKNINTIDRNNTLFKLNDNYLLTGSEEGNIIQYKINNNDIEEISFKRGCHIDKTNNFAFLNNEFILSSGYEGTVKIWSLND